MGATAQRMPSTCSITKWVLLYFVFATLASSLLVMSATETDEVDRPKKNSTNDPLITTKNQTKLIKPIKPTNSTKKPSTLVNKLSNTTATATTSPSKKLNSTKLITSPVSSKKLNSTKLVTSPVFKKLNSTKKPSDLAKASPPKNKTSPITTKEPKPKTPEQIKPKTNESKQPTTQFNKKPSWDSDDDDEFVSVSDFRDFHHTIVPDLQRISRTSKVYINKANKEIIEGFRPLVGKHYAPAVASITSCIFILAPLLLVSLFFNRIKAFFSLQKLIIFIQAYLSIYFTILCFASLATGLEPLRFFYATSQSSYVWLQVLQTLGYVMYLLLLLMYLVLVFSTETGPGTRFVGLAQTFVGFSVGLHYYVKVVHRAVLHQPPKTNWRAHGIYATCFIGICVLARMEWRKKSYLYDGGDEGKKN